MSEKRARDAFVELDHGWFFCEACGIPLKYTKNLTRHLRAGYHAENVAGLANGCNPYPLPNVITLRVCKRVPPSPAGAATQTTGVAERSTSGGTDALGVDIQRSPQDQCVFRLVTPPAAVHNEDEAEGPLLPPPTVTLSEQSDADVIDVKTYVWEVDEEDEVDQYSSSSLTASEEGSITAVCC